MTTWSSSSQGVAGTRAHYLPQRAGVTSVGQGALLCGSAGVFARIFDDGIALCIWNRVPDDILSAYLLRSVSTGTWERMACVDACEPHLEELVCGFEEGVGKIRLTTELTGLVDLFTTLTDARSVGIRMTATRRRECPRFHVDRVGLRLLCTWMGEGTEWLAQEDVVREQLGHQPGGWAEVQRPGALVHSMDPFAVGVFKGEGWPGNAGRGAVHRSPAPTSWRVFVSLDAL
jgi:hypothetical protein